MPAAVAPPPFVRYRFIASFSALPALNDTPDDGPMARRSPVLGFLPSRAGRSFLANLPQPVTATFSPRACAVRLAIPASSATRSTMSLLFCAVRVTAEPGEIADLIRAEKPKLVLLDLMLPGTGGIELMAEVPELSDLPVIFISRYGRDETITRAFEAGAADYIVKPFSANELTTLTATEYEILRILSVSGGQVVTSEALLRQAWDAREPTDTDRVRAFVRQLRAKLGDHAARPAYIFNERGVGYRMPRPGEA